MDGFVCGEAIIIIAKLFGITAERQSETNIKLLIKLWNFL